MSKSRWLAAGALTVALLASGTTAALASTASPRGVDPTPGWTPPPVPNPVTCAVAPRDVGPTWNWNWGRHRDRRCRQQEFDIQFSSLLSDANGDGSVLGTGPITILRGGLDVTSPNPFVDLFETDATGVNSLRLHHQPLAGATIDRITCSIDFAQQDVPWFIVPGSGRGLFAGAIGNGFYNAQFQFSYPTVRNVCTLPLFLTPGLAAFLINFRGGAGLPTPLAVGGDVQAVGLSFVPPIRHVWAPDNGPTGSPTDSSNVVAMGPATWYHG